MHYLDLINEILLILFSTRKVSLTVTPRTLVYHKDMSEYCRRQVVPSVFVGRQIIEANSHILHFSKLDLPYTCYISVRTESENNLILVSELFSKDDYKKACSKNPNQLLVYETSKTFGGYWGPLPDELIRHTYPASTKYYTLKTTAPTLTKTTDLNTLPIRINQSVTQFLKATDNLTTNEDFTTVEVPIVNVSASFLPGESIEKENVDAEDLFKLLYDVTPWPSVKYDTTILPLVQFSIKRHKTTSLWNLARKKSLNFDLPNATPDVRLTYPEFTYSTVKRKPWKKQKYNAIRRFNFKKKHNLYSSKTTTNPKVNKDRYTSIQYPFVMSTNIVTLTRRNIFPKMHTSKLIQTRHIPIFNANSRVNILTPNESWKVIEDSMKTLNRSDNLEETVSANVSNLLHKVSAIKHNFSAYLAPNWSTYDNVPPHGVMPNPLRNVKYIKTNVTLTGRPYKVINTTSVKELFTRNLSTESFEIKINTEAGHSNNTSKLSPSVVASPLFYTQNEESSPTSMESLLENITTFYNSISDTHHRKTINFHNNTIVKVYNATTDFGMISEINSSETLESYFSKTPKLTGSLVGHESWENIVQSAPEMAVLLNETRDGDTGHENKDEGKREKRKKRTLHAIAIEENRPRSLKTRTSPATSEITFDIADMQEFAQLVELKDELQDRVSLRNIRQFSGPILYNICDIKEASGRGVYLFNASRILLFIGNFTMEGMTVILTPARTLLTGDSRCNPSNIECQVSGARVCVDSLVTCDGIPNCGSHDIYDEDRLMCGGSYGMQHNVYLAAFTFFAVTVTIFYIVYYWLKQYVPKVSEAFFIYINGIENILYLDSIMRHPNDSKDDNVSKLIYHDDIFEDDVLYSTDIKTGKMTVLKYLKKIFTSNCLRKKRTPQDDIFFSTFPETELGYVQKESTDISVQTGNSLEMAHLYSLNKRYKQDIHNELMLPPISETEVAGCSTAILNATFSANNLYNHSDELSILKFFRKSRSDSIHSMFFDTLTKAKGINDKTSVGMVEKEVGIHEYEPTSPEVAGPSTEGESFDNHSAKLEWPMQMKKYLRFDEEVTIIPAMELKETVNEHESSDNDCRRDIDLRKTRGLDSNKIDNYDNSGKRFWGKTKKQKKRTQH